MVDAGREPKSIRAVGRLEVGWFLHFWQHSCANANAEPNSYPHPNAYLFCLGRRQVLFSRCDRELSGQTIQSFGHSYSVGWRRLESSVDPNALASNQRHKLPVTH